MAKPRRGSRVGETLAGKYRLDALLGAGGMGEVYRAENVHIGRLVAIKMLKEEHAENTEVVGRFLREARAANIVRHPNVVDVLDIGQTEEGAPFIVQELLEGQDLGAYATSRGGRLEVDEALTLLAPVIEAVAFAHERGVIHRDLKPENVFLARAQNGAIVPKLLDFGISRIVHGDDIKMTATGMTVGTPAYMSPEQIRADRPIDARSDVWALGVILHELLSGALPFDAEAQSGLFVKIVTEAPIPLDAALPGAPPALAAIVAWCLRANPAERFGTATELLRELRGVSAALAGMPMAPAPPSAMKPSSPSVPDAARLRAPTSARTGAAPVVPDLELPAPRPKAADAPRSMPQQRAAAPSAPSAPRIVVDGDFGADIIPTTDISLDLGPAPAPSAQMRAVGARPVARANRALRTEVARVDAPTPATNLLAMGVLWGAVLLVTGLLATFAPLHGGLPVVAWASWLDRAPVWLSGAIAGAALLLGLAAFLAGTRAQPTSWGLVLAAPGLVADALFLAGFAVQGLPRLTGQEGLDALARVLFPWPSMLVFVGLSVLALRYAWRAWASMRPGRMGGTLVCVVLAAGALFVAVEVARGADAAPPQSSLAS
jgi:serine/threonine-protein kinase